MSSQKKTEKKIHARKRFSKLERAELRRLSKEILAEARKIAKMEIRKMAIEVLTEAKVIARWQDKPFYIS